MKLCANISNYIFQRGILLSFLEYCFYMIHLLEIINLIMMKHTTSTLILKNKFAVVILVTIFLSMFEFLNKNSIPENLLKHAQNLKKHFEFELPVWNYQTSCDETHNHRPVCKACNTKV